MFAAERIHADDTTVPVLAKGKTRTGRLWTYVRDDRPFGGADPPAAVFFYSPDRGGEHPEQHLAGYAGLMQADAYAGFNRLYEAGRKPGPIIEAACWAHARRKFFDLAGINKAPIAIEAVERIDALFAIEREINGKPPHERRPCARSAAGRWSTHWRPGCASSAPSSPGQSEIAKAIAYSLNRWDGLTRFLDDGRLCMSNNAAERGVARHRHRPQQLDLRRLRRRRPARRRHLHADRDRQAQRRRSPGLARRRAGPLAGSSGQAHRRAAALELAPAKSSQPKPLEQARPLVTIASARGLYRMRTVNRLVCKTFRAINPAATVRCHPSAWKTAARGDARQGVAVGGRRPPRRRRALQVLQVIESLPAGGVD